MSGKLVIQEQNVSVQTSGRTGEEMLNLNISRGLKIRAEVHYVNERERRRHSAYLIVSAML